MVKQAIGHIGKTAKAPAEMGGFMYTPWETVSEGLGELLATHGIVLWPSMISSEQAVTGTTSKGKTIYRTRVRLDLTFENADDPSDNRSLLWEGEGDDTSDKSTQKAGTSAEKYALMKFFLLGTMEAATSDMDAGSPQAVSGAPQRADTAEVPGMDRPYRERDVCPECAQLGYKTTRGGRPAFFVPKKGPHSGVLQCNGREWTGKVTEDDPMPADTAWLNHPAPLSPQETAAADADPANSEGIPY